MAGNVSGTDFVHQTPFPALYFVGLNAGKEVKLLKFLWKQVPHDPHAYNEFSSGSHTDRSHW